MRDVFMLPSAVAEVLQPDSNPSKETTMLRRRSNKLNQAKDGRNRTCHVVVLCCVLSRKRVNETVSRVCEYLVGPASHDDSLV